MRSWIRTWVFCAVLCLAATPAHALLLDFEELGFGHGHVVSISRGVQIATENLVGGHPVLLLTAGIALLRRRRG